MTSPLPSTHPTVLAILLTALADQEPCARSPKWERENLSGFTRTAWIKCPDCHGTAEVQWKNRTVRCTHPVCQGRGGWHGDPMSESAREIPAAQTDTRDQSVAEFWRTIRDMTLPELEHLDAAIDAATINVILDRGVRAQHPCFPVLAQTRDGMRTSHVEHYAAIVATHEWTFMPIHPSFTALYPEALVILGKRLPATFAAPGRVLVQAQENIAAAKKPKPNPQLTDTQRIHRDEEIRRLAFKGRSQAQIAARLGCSQPTVSKVLNGKQGSKQAA